MVLRAGVLRIRSGPKGSDLAVLYIFAVGTEVRQLPNCKLQRPGRRLDEVEMADEQPRDTQGIPSGND